MFQTTLFSRMFGNPQVFKTVGCLALLVGLSSNAASALTLTVTYTGQVTSGSDTRNLFGLNGASLVGQQYSATYVFDAGLGSGIFVGDQAGGIGFRLQGNPQNSPLINASLNINGSSFVSSGGFTGLTGFAACQPSCVLGGQPYSSISANAGGDGFPNATPQLFNFLADPFANDIPASIALLTASFTYFPTSTDYQIGGLRFDSVDYLQTYNISSVSLELCESCGVLINIQPVPESATWAMLLIGFSGIGFAAYRRKDGRQTGRLITALASGRRRWHRYVR